MPVDNVDNFLFRKFMSIRRQIVSITFFLLFIQAIEF